MLPKCLVRGAEALERVFEVSNAHEAPRAKPKTTLPPFLFRKYEGIALSCILTLIAHDKYSS